MGERTPSRSAMNEEYEIEPGWESAWPPWLYYRMLRRGSGGGGGFAPLSLAPDLFLVAQPSFLFQGLGGTTPVTSDGQAVASAQDQGSEGGFWEQSVAGSRPTYETDGTLHWLEGDGVDDALSKAFAVTGKALYVAAAFMPLSTQSNGRLSSIVSAGAQDDFNTPANAALIKRDGLNEAWDAFCNSVSLNATALLNNTAYVVESIFSDGAHVLAVNGVDAGPVVATHDFNTTDVILLARKADGNSAGNSRLFSYFVRIGAAPTTVERGQLRTYMGATAGLSL